MSGHRSIEAATPLAVKFSDRGERSRRSLPIQIRPRRFLEMLPWRQGLNLGLAIENV